MRLAGNPSLPDVQLFSQALKFTAAVPFTIETIIGVIGQQQFHIRLPGSKDPGRMGADGYGALYGIGTGRHQVFMTLHLDHTQAAGSRGR
jgi:hypothetical protein